MSTDTGSLRQVAPGYGEDNVKTLKDAAHIRQNPGMYIGNTDTAGLHHIVYEIVYNSVDEALAGHCDTIKVTVHVDGSITIADNGRGIPVGVKADTGKSTLEEALTIAGTSGKFDNEAYRVSAGLHGMGAKAMNALAEWCEAEVRRDGRVFQMTFERGYAVTPLRDVGPAPSGQTGTTISFKPDDEIFGSQTFDYETLATRFRQIAYLNKGLAIVVADDRDGRTERFFSEQGIAEYVAYLNTGEHVAHAPVYIAREVPMKDNHLSVSVEIALQYVGGDTSVEQCFTNNAYNYDGGTHLSGFRSGLTRAVTAYGKKEGIFNDKIELQSRDFREGLTMVVSVGHPDPQFDSQPKAKLTSPDVEGMVASVVYEGLADYLEKNPKDANLICKKIMLSAEARIAAKKARDAVTSRKNILNGGGLPGKLMDCTTKERDKSELFLVEGDSAGGSAESGRDRYYQAVLPLRGKVLNVERARVEKLLANNEIAALIGAVGVDIGNVEDIAKLRYGKIIILTDADVDGQHIRTLLLTFFFRQMRKLIEAGHIFVARPPLFKVTQKKEVRFVQTREEMARELFARGLKGTHLEVRAVAGREAPAYPKQVAEADLAGLIRVLDEAEHAVGILERRGHTLESFLARRSEDHGFPEFHVRVGTREQFFHLAEQVEVFRAALSQELGRELVIADDALSGTTAAGDAATDAEAAEFNANFRFTVDEWHEVRALNRAVVKLAEFGFRPTDLVPLPRVAGREPPVRFVLAHGESTKELDQLRQVVPEIRRIGERGLTVTRFKGLGEMDPEELWDTTLKPEDRTLLRVTMTDALKAEHMFRTLMGEEVEGRRDFIFRHRINKDDIDYGS